MIEKYTIIPTHETIIRKDKQVYMKTPRNHK